MTIFGWKLVRVAEEQLKQQLHEGKRAEIELKLALAEKYVGKLEKEVEFYRVRYDEAMERSDRQLDGILAQNGLPEVTATTKRERSAREEKVAAEQAEHEKELAEIFAESIGSMQDIDGLELPPELAAEAAKMMKGNG